MSWKVVWDLVKISIPIPLVLIAAAAIWIKVDKASAVRRAVDQAVERLVYSAENAALTAKLKQERLLREAGERALAGYTRALAESQRADAATDELREKEIADYERKLAESGRGCKLDGGDIEWLRGR